MKKIPKRFFRDKRLEITRILISEMEKWEDAKKPTTEEFLRLIDRLFNVK